MHTDFNQIKILNNNVSSSENESLEHSSITQQQQQQQPEQEEEEIVMKKSTLITDGQYYDLDSISNDLFDNIFEHLCLGVYFDFYKSHKLNSIRLREYSNPNDDIDSKVYENTKLDIFGHSVNGIKKLECACPNCSRTCAAFRLAPHLEKCLGMGRNSSRLASKRIALVIKNSNGTNSE
ncbi:SAGA associated factor 11kDa [Dermatophagoides farinae]|uniref:SAGA-associated factor 11 homolog n=1 Tax=Dermatophagoides farinae TaxID=6954 RepID=A0A922HRR0_DERFA|nr:Ataxin-7-like protein 3 [Dermatophagoides farinae]